MAGDVLVKRQKLDSDSAIVTPPTADLSRFFRSWAWKREHRPDRDRFVKPYIHSLPYIPVSASVTPSAARSLGNGSGKSNKQGAQQLCPEAAAPPHTAAALSKQQQQQQEGDTKEWSTQDNAQCLESGTDAGQLAALMEVPPSDPPQQLIIHQARFKAAGFASTVWDSSIVVARYLEREAEQLVRGARCLDLSAGCGLVAVVMCKLGAAHVTATDLEPNLPLLRRNCNQVNQGGGQGQEGWGEGEVREGGESDESVTAPCPLHNTYHPPPRQPDDLPPPPCSPSPALSHPLSPPAPSGSVEVCEHTWGQAVDGLGAGGAAPWDLVVACDVMYVVEAVGPLLSSLQALCWVGRAKQQGQQQQQQQQGQKGHGLGQGQQQGHMAQAPSPEQTPGSGSGYEGSMQGQGQDQGLGRSHQQEQQQSHTYTPPACTAVRAAAAATGIPQPARASPSTTVIVAHGRNRFAEAEFLRQAAGVFNISTLGDEQLHPDFTCDDVTVLKLVLK